MKATEVGISMRAASAHHMAAHSISIVTVADQLAHHQGNVRQLFAHRRAVVPEPVAPDADEIIGLVAQVYGLPVAVAAERLAALDFAALRAPNAA